MEQETLGRNLRSYCLCNFQKLLSKGPLLKDVVSLDTDLVFLPDGLLPVKSLWHCYCVGSDSQIPPVTACSICPRQTSTRLNALWQKYTGGGVGREGFLFPSLGPPGVWVINTIIALPNTWASFKSQRKPSPSDNPGKRVERKLPGKCRASRRANCSKAHGAEQATSKALLDVPIMLFGAPGLKRDETCQ